MNDARGLRESRIDSLRKAILIGAVVVVVVVLAGWLSSSNSQDDEGSERGAMRACQGYVESQLKSPGTADFSMEAATQDGGPDWTVTGVVDSENTFGGVVRNGYRCEVTSTGDDNWTLSDLQTDGN